MVYIRVIGSIVEPLFPVCLIHISLRFTGFLCLKNAKPFPSRTCPNTLKVRPLPFPLTSKRFLPLRGNGALHDASSSIICGKCGFSALRTWPQRLKKGSIHQGPVV